MNHTHSTVKEYADDILSERVALNGRPLLTITTGVTLSFVLVKRYARPLVLKSTMSEFLHIFVLSYPNFCEAIIGSFLLVYWLSHINHTYVAEKNRISEPFFLPDCL